MIESITSLSDLAAQANENHQLAEATAGRALEFARLSGIALTEAKSQVGHGGWIAWLNANFHATERTAQKYMKLSANANCDSYLEAKSINEALRMIAGEDEEEESAEPEEDTPSPDEGEEDEDEAEPQHGAVEEGEPEEARAVAVEVVEEDEEYPTSDTEPEVEPEAGVALVYARTAIDALNKIPKRDPSRKAAIKMISDWLNKQ